MSDNAARQAVHRLFKVVASEKVRSIMLQKYGLQLPDGCTYKDLLKLRLEQMGESNPRAAEMARELSTVTEDDSI